MADVKMSEMDIDASLDGTERMLAQGAAGSVILVSALAAYAVDQLHGATVITSLVDTDQAVIFATNDDEKIITVENLAKWVVDTIEAVAVSTIAVTDWVIFSDAGVLKKITLANLTTSFVDIPISKLDIDGGTDINAALADGDLIIVDDGAGGANRYCPMSRVYTYIVGEIQGQTAKVSDTPVDADILMIQDSENSWELRELTVGGLWDNRYAADMLAVTDVSTASWLIDDDALTAASDTKVATQGNVKAYVDAQAGFTVAAAAPLTVAPVSGDYMVISDESNSNVNRKVYVQELFDVAGRLTDLGAIPAIDDRVLLTDESTALDPARSTTVEELLGAVGAVTALSAAPATNDRMICTDTSASAVAKAITVAELFEAYFEDMTAGSGITAATNATCEHRVSRVGGLYKTEIVIDLTGLNSGANANDIIGKADTANCHIGQITAAVNGTIFAGRMTCLETPAGGDDDIDLWDAIEATGTEDADIEDALTGEHQLTNGGNLTAGTVVSLTTFPTVNQYLYLTAGTGDINNTYTTGILLIELWGKPA